MAGPRLYGRERGEISMARGELALSFHRLYNLRLEMPCREEIEKHYFAVLHKWRKKTDFLHRLRSQVFNRDYVPSDEEVAEMTNLDSEEREVYEKLHALRRQWHRASE